MLNNKNFYPTPNTLIIKMCCKVQMKHATAILEPSAGKGNIVEYIEKNRKFGKWGRACENIKAIELDTDLIATLQGKDIDVIDQDFLTYSGKDVFDLILMNPPFDHGEKHLLKAIDIMYSGEIVCLLNAETIKNAHTVSRKELCSQLAGLGADIEYISNGFVDAERKTNTEIALIHIKIERDLGEDLFKNCDDKIHDTTNLKEEERGNLAVKDGIKSLVDQYNQKHVIGLNTITEYCRNSDIIGGYLQLSAGKTETSSSDSLNTKAQKLTNRFTYDLRKNYWEKAIKLNEINKRLTSENRKRVYSQLSVNSKMDFTENNVKQFVVNLIGSYEQSLVDAMVKLFDMLTTTWSYYSECDKNKLHFSTWKTNTAFKVSKKIIIPCHQFSGIYGNPFYGWGGGTPELSYGARDMLDDVDKALNHIAGYNNYCSTSEAIESRMHDLKIGYEESTRNIESSFFKKVSFFKKGTLHLEFADDDVLRRFNVIACQGKGWLPDDYGKKSYDNCNDQEQALIESFEGKKSYVSKQGQEIGFAGGDVLMLEGVQKQQNTHAVAQPLEIQKMVQKSFL